MRILIAGDSFGCGEWKDGQLTHQGLSRHLMEQGHLVQNLSIPGGHHMQIVDSLQRHKIKKQYDFIFVFFTDVLRNVDPLTFWADLDDINFYRARYANDKKYFLKEYNRLKKKIYFIGGLSMITNEDVKDFKYLEIAHPSFYTLIEPSFKHPYSTWYEHLFPTIPSNISKKLLYQIDKEYREQEKIKNHQYLPDGIHPDRHAHYALYEYLKKKFSF